MTLAEDYNFEDFTREHYRVLLGKAKEHYTFRSFHDFDSAERFVLWRHDIDWSPHAARAVARIEEEEGCSSTFFVNIHSEFYNVFEQDVARCIFAILDLGHRLGVHLDVQYYADQTEQQTEEAIDFERKLLERTFGCRVDAVSLHNPTTTALPWRRYTYAGLVNTYADYFQQEVGYCSDSNGYWRHRRLLDVLSAAADDRLQVLTHPGLWLERAMSPRARMHRAVLGRARKVIGSYDAWLATHHRENVCEVGVVFERLREIDRSTADALELMWFSGRPDVVFRELSRLTGEARAGSSTARAVSPDAIAKLVDDLVAARMTEVVS